MERVLTVEVENKLSGLIGWIKSCVPSDSGNLYPDHNSRTHSVDIHNVRTHSHDLMNQIKYSRLVHLSAMGPLLISLFPPLLPLSPFSSPLPISPPSLSILLSLSSLISRPLIFLSSLSLLSPLPFSSPSLFSSPPILLMSLKIQSPMSDVINILVGGQAPESDVSTEG